MAHALNKLTIKGFKSIQSLEDFELTNLNVLIGGNGAGKSNFIDFFRMLRAMMELPLPGLNEASLQTFIAQGGGNDDFLFNGPKVTNQIEAIMLFGVNGYQFKLLTTTTDMFTFGYEGKFYSGKGWESLGSGHYRPNIIDDRNKRGITAQHGISWYIYNSIESWKIYHFHDTSTFAPMRRSDTIEDRYYLRFDASNLAPFLLYLSQVHQNYYNKIINTIQLVTPFFGDFILEPNGNNKVGLLWKQKGSDYPLKAHHLSDGTLRFICLTTALLQPNLPSTIIIDEPELGLHPYAIDVLAELIHSASQRTQVIVSTQSPALVDNFDPEHVIVVNRKDGASVFERLNKDDLTTWLEDYSLGDLWRKNVVAGGPVHE